MQKDAILKSIGAIGRAAKKLTRDVQNTATACLIHAVRHGDVTLADQLVDVLGKGVRRDSLRAWFEKNGPFYIAKGKTTFSFDSDRAKSLRGLKDDEITAMLADKPWEEAKREPEVQSVLDVASAADKFLERIQKQANEAGMEVRNRGLLEALVATAQQWHAAEVLKSAKVPETVEAAQPAGNLRRAA